MSTVESIPAIGPTEIEAFSEKGGVFWYSDSA
jgi:hypothetical protein